jgi:FGGY-family pentulose kinase
MDRSLCTTVCKWTYLGHEDHGWNHEYFESIGIDELLDDDYQKIGSTISPPGKALDSGLSEDAAKDFGLPAGIPVGVSMIDAHAGGIGLLGMAAGDEELTSENIDTRLALIGGTSSCHMAASSDAQKVPGVWGPYYSAMVPDFWLTEGGQSATGALVDHIIFSSSRAAELKSHAADEDTTVYELLNRELYRLAGSDEKIPYLTRDLHVLPYFHGNRSPRADASLTGIISGLTLDDSISSLALRYLAAIQAIALGTRHIIDEMNAAGFRISTIMATGGGTKNPVFLQAHADICGCEIILPEEAESVLLGSAMLGAVAAGEYGDLPTAMSTMSRPGEVISPDHSNANYYEGKYRVFLQMYEDQQQYKTIMNKEHAL